MSTNLLVSASTTVKIWDITAITRSTKANGSTNSSVPEQLFGVELTSFKPEGTSETINAARWSHDNQHLAVAGSEGALTIHNPQGKLLESITPSVDGLKTPSINSVRFANKSRYVLFGGSDKVVNIWDRENSTFTDPLKGHRSDITCIDLNVDEAIVASSSSSGHILVHNRLKSNTCDNLTVLTKQPINVLEYSFFKRGLLAAGGDDGSLRLWDTSVSTTALQTFENVHHFAIRGIAFSPFNSHLMCSAGLDNHIVLYDVGKKSTLKTIYTETHLTALGFKTDGVTIVAGTQNGRILVYDLRSTSKPMCTLYGHESFPIKCLHFQEKERSTERRSTLGRKLRPSRPPSKGSISPSSFVTPTKSTLPPSTPNESKDKNIMDVFSPVKDTTTEETHGNAKPREPVIKEKQKLTQNNGVPKEITKISTMDLKLNDEVTQDEAKRDNGFLNDVLVTGTMDDLRTKIVSKVKETIDGTRGMSVNGSDPVLPNIANSRKRVSFIDNEMMSEIQELTTEKPSVMPQLNGSNGAHDATILREIILPSEEANVTLQPPSPKIPKGIDRSTSPEVIVPTLDPTVDGDGVLIPVENNSNTGSATNFQLQVIGNVVDECLQEFRISLRNDIQNMHLELLRQFHIQKEEMELMFLKYCGETMSLREEVERLREENQRLKMKF
ncbi:2865_t:CDS:10 [Acaulospora morrowiae]|uniref:2865_t:CDS:1 n=1 Tax=Acaulospora morrowiae TaxID=94023 RepID=A0A9N9G532_9GLOM|nr:2865_t:CDS:10 [Acaulospora morrowiae]